MIVVFTFQNLGPADDAYFAAGISEEITSRLATLQGLGVLSRNSAVQYDRTGKTMQQIAKDLGVDYVLDGSVRWARKSDGTSQVRITPQLVHARDDLQIWSNSTIALDGSPHPVRIATEVGAGDDTRPGDARLSPPHPPATSPIPRICRQGDRRRRRPREADRAQFRRRHARDRSSCVRTPRWAGSRRVCALAWDASEERTRDRRPH
jgi:hypothetical protein